MRAVIRRIIEAAAVDIPVLITGETRHRKKLVAAAIHKADPSQRQTLCRAQHRRNGAFGTNRYSPAGYWRICREATG
jgi:hypothetical protein